MDRGTEKNVVTEREKNIEKMRKKIRKAIANPISLENYIVESSQSEVDEYINTMPLKEEDIVNYEQENNVLGTVIIKDSHDYPLLLEMVTDELNRAAGFRQFSKPATKEEVKHEYEHHVPALDQPGLKTMYGVLIFKDTLGNYAYQPYLTHRGSVPYYVYKDIVSTPSTHSNTDKRKLGKK